MKNFKINYDFRPYIPDLDIKTNIYNTSDSINNNTNVDINTMIFIININEPIESIYNDPKYILFGDKKLFHEYKYPSLNFFSSQEDLSTNIETLEYNIIYQTNKLTAETSDILSKIGFDLLNIEQTQFVYMVLEIRENITNIKYTVLYFYFNLKNYGISNEVNYNYYNSTIYYNDKTHNILIYPYYNYDQSTHYVQTPVKKCASIDKNHQTNKFIKSIDFNNKELIKYFEKIDYKYFENTEYSMNNESNMETLISYSNNIKNYVEFIDDNFLNDDFKTINIGLNEITKMFFYSVNYNLKNENTYTIRKLNNKHLNNYNSYSNQNNVYSYSMDKKISNLNHININSKKYSSYYYSTNTNSSTLYQQIINYRINFYYNLSNENRIWQVNKLNFLLHKIFVYINPKIIDLNYLLSNVRTSISPIFDGSNDLKFGTGNDKLQLYIVGDIKKTNIYYIDNYKISFKFDADDGNNFSYVIILSMSFSNNDFFTILDTDQTSNTPLVYTNFTTIEESVSLSPSIYCVETNDKNIDNSIINSIEFENNFYNTISSFKNDNNVKNYYYNINYSNKDDINSSNNIVSMYNFYDMIPNLIINNKLNSNQTDFFNNTINLLKTKVNYFIKNIVYIQNNYAIYTHYKNTIKKYINYTGLFDENITMNEKKNRYVEYFDYFPKITEKYIKITENYVGKYSQVLLYPYDNKNISSFEVIPSGKYIKFNYTNYMSLVYPDVVDEQFVKSIKTIEDIFKYNFSLLILLAYNLNEDDDFYCQNENDFLSSNYSMGIGGNKSLIYLVLTDKNNTPFDFYGSNEDGSDTKTKGVIYGIKLFDYQNYLSDNLKLNLIPNIFMNKYINLNEFMIIFENISNYTDANNMLWDINNTNFNLHNFKSLKEIVLYDFKRFKSNYDLDQIYKQYSKFSYKKLSIIYENKKELNNIRYCIKILIYLSNLYKILKLIQKIIVYYKITSIKIIYGDFNNDYLIKIIGYNLGIISNLFQINYNLCISSGIFEKKIYDYISEMYGANSNLNLEIINNFQTYCEYIINYSMFKIPTIINFIIVNVSKIENLYQNIYFQIFKQVIYEDINYLLGELLIKDVDSITSNIDPNMFNNILINKNNIENKIFSDLINSCLKCVVFNYTKIYELFNLAKLMANKQINDLLPENLDNSVIKNYYMYNTTCYKIKTNVPKFDIVNFLYDTIELVEKLSIPSNNVEYENYQKSISQGILVYANNTINYFKNIINTIVKIYTGSVELNGSSGSNNLNTNNDFDINDPNKIGYFYDLLTLFEKNYLSFFDVLFKNKIDKFYEYKELKKSLENLYQSSLEFLLYVELKNDFLNLKSLSTNGFLFNLNDDLLKLIKIDSLNEFIIKTLNNVDDLIIKKNPLTTHTYTNKIINHMKKNTFYYNNKSTIEIINQLIFELKNNIINKTTNDIDIIKYGSYYVIPYEDLLLFKESFDWYSFNFNPKIIELVKTINNLNLNIFEFYYNNKEINDFYKQMLNYTYLKCPFTYINLLDTKN